ILEIAPTTVSVTLSEAVEPRFCDVEVFAEDGTRVDRGDSRIDGDQRADVSLNPLGRGGYTVRWRALGYDGHLADGAFSFGVGRAAPPSTINPLRSNLLPEALVRWMMLAALAGLVGAVAWRVLVVGPLARTGL